MSEIINWFISSELENKNYKQILMITKGDKTSWGMYKYDLTDFMEKYGFKSIEQLIDYLNKHIKEKEK